MGQRGGRGVAERKGWSACLVVVDKALDECLFLGGEH